MAQLVHHTQPMANECNTQDLCPWLNGPDLPAKERHLANLEGAVAGQAFRVAELKARGCSKTILEREERSLLAYQRMLKEAKG